jgi:phosphatidylglycerol---prolipoprotein diacylglyceryl transferase
MVLDSSPFVIKFSESFGIHWYGLFYLLSVVAAYFIIRWFSSRQHTNFTKESTIDFIAFAGIGMLVGARLGYLLYEPNLFIQFRTDFPFWGILAIDDGGLSIHGAMFGLFISTFLFSLKSGISQLYLLDLSSLICAIAIMFGRIASFFNGEHIGRTMIEADGVGTAFVNHLMENLLVKFPQEILQWPVSHFSKLESLTSIIEKLPGLSKESWLTGLQQYHESEQARALVQGDLEQIVHAVQNGNSGVLDALSSLLEFRHPVQLYAAFGEGFIVFLFLFILWFKPRRPGVITSWFISLYSLIRIFEEQFALPEVQLGFRWLGVTQAQWLSILSFIFGLWLIFFYGRSSGLATPGWGLGQHVKIHRR